MSLFKTLLAGGLGWALGGPIGAIIGVVASKLLKDLPTAPQGQRSGGDYFLGMLVLITAVMKADKKIMKSELDYVKNFLLKSFGEAKAKESLILIKDLLKKDIPVNDVCHQINQNINKESRIQMVHFLFGLALSDGILSHEEEELIRQIAFEFQMNSNEYQSVKSMFIQDVNWAYRVLEISPEATDKEVAKAFRVMAIKYHPDKVADQGEDVVKAANEKFQTLNEAYQAIKKERNI